MAAGFIEKKLYFRNIEDVNSSIVQASNRQCDINTKVEDVLSHKQEIQEKVLDCSVIINNLYSVKEESKQLYDLVANAANLANSVREKVSRLDVARSRAFDCQGRVHDLIDLHTCKLEVENALKKDDIEYAAVHIARFLSMDKSILERTAVDVEKSASSTASTICILEEATLKASKVTTEKFNVAAKNFDDAGVEKLFKIFPLLNKHHIGIESLSKYTNSKLSKEILQNLTELADSAQTRKKTNISFSKILSSYLEGYARAFRDNISMVKTHYGQEYVPDMALELQKNCDAGVIKVLAGFLNREKVLHNIKQLETFRNQSFYAINATSKSSGSYKKLSEIIDRMDSKEIDSLITDICSMHSRMELYLRFLRRYLVFNSSTEGDEGDVLTSKLNQIIENAALKLKMEELLGLYLFLERYFMEENVLKAISIDSANKTTKHSSLVEDVFFILRKCVLRSVSCLSISGICAVIDTAILCLDAHFVNSLKMKFKGNYVTDCSDLVHPTGNDKARCEFIVHLNDVSTCIQYITTLWRNVEHDIKLHFPTLSAKDQQSLESCTSKFKEEQERLQSLVNTQLRRIYSSTIKPRLTSWVDQFLQYDHAPSAEDYDAYHAKESFVQFLIVHIDEIFESYKDVLNVPNYEGLVSVIITEIISLLERNIKRCSFNRLGGLSLDQEVRSLCTYLRNVISSPARDKISRILQIATLLSLETLAELNDYWNPEEESKISSWQLTPNEMKNILHLRTDFRDDLNLCNFQISSDQR